MQSPFFSWPYPNENDDPWFDKFTAFINALDASVFGLVCSTMGGNVIMGGGQISNSVSGSQGVISWTDDFLMPIIGSGYFLQIRFGPDEATRQLVLNEGDRVVVTVPATSSQNVITNFTVINGKITSSNLPNLFTFGMFKNGKFWSNFLQLVGSSSTFISSQSSSQAVGSGFTINALASYIQLTSLVGADVSSSISTPFSTVLPKGTRIVVDNSDPFYNITLKFSPNLDLPNSFDLQLTPGSAAEFISTGTKYRCVGSSIL